MPFNHSTDISNTGNAAVSVRTMALVGKRAEIEVVFGDQIEAE